MSSSYTSAMAGWCENGLRLIKGTFHSNMLHPYRGAVDDDHHDLPHPFQIHSSRYVPVPFPHPVLPSFKRTTDRPLDPTTTGRKEIVIFFYLFMVDELLAIFLDSAIIPTANGVYPVCHHLVPLGVSNVPE